MTDEIQTSSEADYSTGIEFVGFDMPEKEVKRPDEPEFTLEEPEAVEATPEPEPEVVDPEVNEAKSRGWTSKAEWIAAGKNADDWVNAKHFNEKGRLISQARKLETLEKTFDQRVGNVQKLAQMQAQIQLQTLQQENERLKVERKQAITYGDAAAVEILDGQLMSNALTQVNVQQHLQESSPQAQIQRLAQDRVQKEIEWNRSNPWITDGSEKAQFAIQLYNDIDAKAPMSTFEERIEFLNAEIAKKFPVAPKVNENRTKPAMTDTKTSTHAKGGKLTMADLTPDERSQWNAFGKSMFGTESAFLQAVADTRRG